MKITSIKSQAKDRGRVNIFVDEEYCLAIPEKMIVDFDIYKGKEITEKDLEVLKSGDSNSKCLDKAYHFLSYRPRSEKEMKDKLLEKYDEKTVDETIAKLKEYNLINDADFARMWVESRKMGRGPKALSFELKRKGIDGDIIENALAEIDTEEQYETALTLIRARSKYKGLDRNEAYKKVAPFLSRRGYTYDIISKVIKEIAN
jgi:regulatory protein